MADTTVVVTRSNATRARQNREAAAAILVIGELLAEQVCAGEGSTLVFRNNGHRYMIEVKAFEITGVQ